MKTLLFAPCYLDGDDRLVRNLKWLSYYRDLKGTLKYDDIYMVDNASSPENLKKLEPHWVPDLHIHKRHIHFARWQEHAYAYWYVAFRNALEFAIENNYDKIIHVDTDVYLLTPKICDYVNNSNTGWISFWSEIHKYPDSTFQIINKDQFQNALQFYKEDFLEFYPYDLAETRIPFTKVERQFVGDRYGDFDNRKQTPEMDFYGQCLVSNKLVFNIQEKVK